MTLLVLTLMPGSPVMPVPRILPPGAASRALVAAQSPDRTSGGVFTDEKIRDTVRSVLADKRYQTKLPRPEPEMMFPPIFSGVVKVLMVAGLAVLVIILAMWATQEMRRRRARRDPRLEDDFHAAEARVSGEPLADAAVLAREGRYGDAIHVLLLRTIEELRRGLDYLPPPSRTSREMLEEVQLAGRGKLAFVELVREVELSYFGGQPVDSDDYERCVELFRELAAACEAGVS